MGATDGNNRRRPPTGPAVRASREGTAFPGIATAAAAASPLLERYGGLQNDTPTRQIDTKPLVSAAFEEEDDPGEELGFDRPLFDTAPAPLLRVEAAGGDEEVHRKRTDSSVQVAMDFDDDSEEHTPASLWRHKEGAPAPAPAPPWPPPSSSARPPQVTGPQLPAKALVDGLLPARPSGSARRRHRPDRTTAQLPRQGARASGAGGKRIVTYVLIGATLGLAIGLFVGFRGGTQPPAVPSSALATTSQHAVERVARRRELSAADRRALAAVRREMDARRWVAAQRAFDRLPARLREDVAVGYWLGRILAARGKHEAAVDALQKLLLRAPAAAWRAELGLELSEVLLAAGHRAAALAAARKAKLELDADASEALASRVVRQLRRCSQDR